MSTIEQGEPEFPIHKERITASAALRIMRRGDYWIFNAPYYNDLGLRESDWVYSKKIGEWATKDDLVVKTAYERFVIFEADREILNRRVMERAINLELSYKSDADTVIDERLYPFQNVTPPEILKRNILLTDEMGLGKTVQAIMAINQLKPDNVLIIVPNMMVGKWYAEIDNWLSPECQDTQIYICPWSRITKMDLDVNWDFVIVDEAHYGKNIESQRAKAFMALKGKRRMALTGTPILGRPDELYNIAHWVEPFILGSRAAFERRYMRRQLKTVRTRYGYKQVWGKPEGMNIEELQQKLRETIMISRFKKDVLPQLPEKTRSIITLDVSTEVKRLDSKLMTLWMEAQETPDKMTGWANIVAIRKEAAMLKVPYVNAYIDELFEEMFVQEMIEGKAVNKPFVIWAHHHEVIDAIKDHILATPMYSDIQVAVLDGRVRPERRGLLVEQFQNGEIDVLIAGITAAGVGITLTRSDVAIFAELDWTPANMVQAEDRLHRIGQTNNVNIFYCVAPNSLDSRIAEILSYKQDIIDSFNEDLLREII